MPRSIGPEISRRSFLGTVAAGGVAAGVVNWRSLDRLLRGEAIDIVVAAGACAGDGGYGPLGPATDSTTGATLLAAPAGFSITSFGWAGDPLDGGGVTPLRHDGMGAFTGADGSTVIVRNHENVIGPTFGGPVYDPSVGGGTTTVHLDPDTLAVRSQVGSLSGTLVNCSGGGDTLGHLALRRGDHCGA